MKEDKTFSIENHAVMYTAWQQFDKSDGFEEKVFSTIISFLQVKNQISLSSYISLEEDARKVFILWHAVITQ